MHEAGVFTKCSEIWVLKQGGKLIGTYHVITRSKREISKIGGICHAKEGITQECIIIYIVLYAHAVVCERTVMAHHFDTGVTPAAMVGSEVSNLSTLDTYFITFDEASFLGEFFLGLWVSWLDINSAEIVKNDNAEYIDHEDDVSPAMKSIISIFSNMRLKIAAEEQPSQSHKHEHNRHGLSVADEALRW